MSAKAIPPDYDTNPARFRANVRTIRQYGMVDDVHEEVAERIVTDWLTPVLDLGCGEGRLTNPLHERSAATVAFDYSPTMLSAVADPRVRGDANRLPFRDGSFGSVAALYMLYHLDEPRYAIGKAGACCARAGFSSPARPAFTMAQSLRIFCLLPHP